MKPNPEKFTHFFFKSGLDSYGLITGHSGKNWISTKIGYIFIFTAEI